MRSSDNSDDRITRETLSYPCPSSPSSTIYIYIYMCVNVIIFFAFVAGEGDCNVPASSSTTCVLTRLLSVAGQVAIKQLVHLEENISGELKRRRDLQSEKKNKSKTKPSKHCSDVSMSTTKVEI